MINHCASCQLVHKEVGGKEMHPMPEKMYTYSVEHQWTNFRKVLSLGQLQSAVLYGHGSAALLASQWWNH